MPEVGVSEEEFTVRSSSCEVYPKLNNSIFLE